MTIHDQHGVTLTYKGYQGVNDHDSSRDVHTITLLQVPANVSADVPGGEHITLEFLQACFETVVENYEKSNAYWDAIDRADAAK